MVEIPVDPETAAALADPRRRSAAGAMIQLLLRQRPGQDTLGTLLETTRRDAATAGLTDRDIDDELAAWKAERAARDA